MLYSTRCFLERDENGDVVPWEMSDSIILDVNTRRTGEYFVHVARETDGGYVTFSIDRIQELEVIDETDG